MRERVNNQSLGEEISNAISHGVGALLSVAGMVILIVLAVSNQMGAMAVFSASFYGAALILLYTCSCIYHAFANNMAKRVFRIFDHSSIFLLILGTYTPICLTVIGGALGWTIFGINCFCAVLGIVLNSINLKKFEKISMVLYIVMGWMIIFSIKPLLGIISIRDFMMLLGGGLAYTLGIFFYVNKRFKFAHFIWHIFVIAGSCIHYFFMLLYYMG